VEGKCSCNNISYKEICHIVDKHDDVKSIDDLQQYCYCADKCNNCRSDIEEIIDLFRKEK